MGTVNTKGRCPKCSGSLYLEKDYNGWYEECLQCGYVKDLAVVYQSRKKTEKEAREKPGEKSGAALLKRDAPSGK